MKSIKDFENKKMGVTNSGQSKGGDRDPTRDNHDVTIYRGNKVIWKTNHLDGNPFNNDGWKTP